MFTSCKSLVNAPDLPATTLAGHCYEKMFALCSQLASAPDLPATTLAEGCYKEMFSNCTSLTTAPVLPAPTLVNYCYYLMFENCSNLNNVTCLATSISAFYSTGSWLDGVAAIGTFIKAGTMFDWTSGASGIPSGWTVSVVGGLSGKFTVADGKQVYFSKGNLQASTTDSWKSWTWSFMDHQYSTVETNNQDVGSYYSKQNTVSLFGWGTSGYNYGAYGYKPNTTEENSSFYGPYSDDLSVSDKSDWGYNAISNGGNSENHGWRTLSNYEWGYLIYNRSEASSKWGLATVCGVKGLVLLPDNWTTPSGCTFTPRRNNGWTTNSYDTEQWGLMEAAGAVFLPAASYRDIDNVDASNYGRYWSSTNGAYAFNFDTSEVSCSSRPRKYGYSVRLVIDVN